jgi:hypothetical protein
MESGSFIIRTRKQKPPDDTLSLMIQTHPRLYIWGPHGIGKTWSVRKILDRPVELDADMLRSKQGTLDIINRASGSQFFIDDYDAVSDLIGTRELGIVKRLIIIGNTPLKDPGLFIYEYPRKTLQELQAIGKLYGVDNVAHCNGDIRKIIHGDDKDVFWTPKDFVKSLISKDGTRDPRMYYGETIEEHGHVMDLIHDNYIDSDADPCEILECLSLASIYDEHIYSGKWNLLPYFSLESCLIPATIIGHSIKGELRPGSNWTKFSSMCMRRKNVKAMCRRVIRAQLDIDSLMVLRDYFEKGQGIELLKSYDIHKCDLDVLSHLCIVKKLKAKTVLALKKQCLE